MKIVATTTLPESLFIDGEIEIIDSKFFANCSSQNIIDGFRVELTLSVNAEVSGFPISFKSKTSHTLSDTDFINFMKYLKV